MRDAACTEYLVLLVNGAHLPHLPFERGDLGF